MGPDSPLGPSPSENTPLSAQGGAASRSETQRTCWSREWGRQGPSPANTHPQAAGGVVMESGGRRGTNSSPEATQPRAPTLRPRAGPLVLGRRTPAVTARSRAGFGWSRWGWPELAWKGVMEPESPTAFGSSQTKGSLGTQALDPIAVTQHAEGHFISFSAFFG